MTRRVVVLAGGFGGAKLSHGLATLADELALELSIVVNTGDDLEVHGLAVCPDLDTVMYTLAGEANRETGWGLRDETWSAASMLARYGEPTWFSLGDRDLATHIVRTARLRRTERLTEVTASLAASLGIRARLLPMSDDRVRTRVRTVDGWLDFQEWFVRRRHEDPALELRLDGIEAARATPEVLAVIAEAERIVLAPSNPFVSIGPILAVPGLLDAVRSARAPVVAVSPIVAGAALRGPADRMFASLGGEASALGVARHYVGRYPGLLERFVLDQQDAASLPDVEALGIVATAAQTVMTSDADRADLARVVLGA